MPAGQGSAVVSQGRTGDLPEGPCPSAGSVATKCPPGGTGPLTLARRRSSQRDSRNGSCSLSQEQEGEPLIQRGFDLYSSPPCGPAASQEPGCAGAMPSTTSASPEQPVSLCPLPTSRFSYPHWQLCPVHLSRMCLQCPGDPTHRSQCPAPRALRALRLARPSRGKVCAGEAATARSHATVDRGSQAEGCGGRNAAGTVLPMDVGANRPAGTNMDTQPCAGDRGWEGCGSAAGCGDKLGRRLQLGWSACARPQSSQRSR